MKYLPLFCGRIKNRLLTEKFTQQLLKELGLHRLRTFPLVIEFSKSVNGGHLGICEGSQEYALISIATKCPDTGKPLTYLEMMMTLAHEMVHAKQFIRGELSGLGIWRWKGRKAEGYKYENQPWEREAFKLENILFQKCFPLDASFRQ